MSEDMKIIPELRFPEFQNQGEWENDSIDNQFDLQDGYPFSSFDFTKDKEDSTQVIRITDINNQNSNEEKVYLPNSKIKDLDISKYEVHSGDLLLSLTGAAGFNFFIWNTDSGFINQRTMKIRPKKQDNEALKFLLEPLIHSKINSIGTGQNNNLSKDALKEVELPFPKPKEQKKLSSFITNLNDLIAAHSQKLDLLKDHKKGLMQNLFPQEGEKVPKVRFKEFEKDGEWVEKVLSEVANYENGKAHEKDIDENGSYIVVNSKFISTDGEVAKFSNEAYYLAEKGDILMVLSDIPNGRAIAKCFYVNEENKYTVNQRICKITSFECDSQFLYYVMNRNAYFLAFDDGVKQTNLRNDDVQSFPFLMPLDTKEQQKIASCLSSLDTLITAQTEKIEQLQQHKKGLMQGLFPKIND